MADFLTALKLTLKYEGRYANNPKDAGGETYRGISRVIHPDWQGWVIIDACRRDPKFPACLEGATELQRLVQDWYRAEFWDRLWLGKIPDQELANELLEQATLLGPVRPAMALQRLLNVLNRGGSLWSDIEVDGWLRGKTLAALERCLAVRPPTYLTRGLNALELEYLIERMEARPQNEEFAGWFERG